MSGTHQSASIASDRILPQIRLSIKGLTGCGKSRVQNKVCVLRQGRVEAEARLWI